MDPARSFWCEYPRDVIVVRGRDAGSYLHSQVAQDTAAMAVSDSRWTLVLEPGGRIEVLARVWRRGDDEYVLDTDAGSGEAMIARLARFKIRVAADIEPLPWRCLALVGAGADHAAAGTAERVVGWWGSGRHLLGEAPVAPEGVDHGTADDLEAARVAAGWPAMGREIVSGETIPAETGLAPVAVSFTKGCYPGQELVERMDSRGARAPRSLRALEVVAGSRPGDAIVVDGEAVGTLTSVAGTTALGYVRRNAEAGRPVAPS